MAQRKHSFFSRIAHTTSRAAGSPPAFLVAVALVVGWAITGPLFNYSEMWQLIINTGTTIVTFLMVFLIQNSTNRETQALNIKIDELIRASGEATNAMLDLEDLEIGELEELRKWYVRRAEEARDRLETRRERPLGALDERINHLEDHIREREE